MKEQVTTHEEQLVFLKKIEGQVRGIQKMIENKEYCVDILNQIHAAICALARVEDKVLEKHLEGCVSGVMQGKSAQEKSQKLSEVIKLIHQFRKI